MRLERADCREWLRQTPAETFELIFSIRDVFKFQTHAGRARHSTRSPQLIGQCMQRLSPADCWSSLQRAALPSGRAGRRQWQVRDVSAQTLPFDFARNPRVHRCFEISAARRACMSTRPDHRLRQAASACRRSSLPPWPRSPGDELLLRLCVIVSGAGVGAPLTIVLPWW